MQISSCCRSGRGSPCLLAERSDRSALTPWVIRANDNLPHRVSRSVGEHCSPLNANATSLRLRLVPRLGVGAGDWHESAVSFARCCAACMEGGAAQGGTARCTHIQYYHDRPRSPWGAQIPHSLWVVRFQKNVEGRGRLSPCLCCKTWSGQLGRLLPRVVVVGTLCNLQAPSFRMDTSGSGLVWGPHLEKNQPTDCAEAERLTTISAAFKENRTEISILALAGC